VPPAQVAGHGRQNLNIDNCNKEHNLVLADDGYGLVQKQSKGVRGILSPYHVYINTCARYSSTPYLELLSNLKKQVHGSLATAMQDRAGWTRVVHSELSNKYGSTRAE
jgi:hypothetical protein